VSVCPHKAALISPDRSLLWLISAELKINSKVCRWILF